MREMKYFGVTLDSKLSFIRHIRTVSTSASSAARAIGRLMPNVGGPSMLKRKLLASVISNRLLYAVLVWASRVAKFRTNSTALAKAQRIAALRITRRYRTVSTAAALFLAEMPPADLVALERETVRRRRKDLGESGSTVAAKVKAATIRAWQTRWSEETVVAGWTRRVLPSIQKWI